MRTRYPLWLLPLLLLMFHTANAQTKASAPLKMTIEKGWEFRQSDKPSWYPARVPGDVHMDLLANKLIEDPFYRDNETKQQWIGKTDWEYRTSFKVNLPMLDRKNIELVFDGLDTYADVYLNDKPILKADNMFRTWRVD